MKKIFKRLIAYLIDMLIIVTLTQLISNTTLFNPNLNKYQKYSKEYNEITERTSSFVLQLQKYYQDSTISEKEYNKLINKYPTYEEVLNKYYKDNKLTEKNYVKLMEEITSDYQQKANNLSYQIEKNSISQMFIYLIVTILYFVGFNYLTNGQTLGKKIFGLKIISIDNHKVSIVSYLIRSIIMYEIIYYLIRLITIFILNKTQYLEMTRIIYMIQNALDFIIVAFMIIRSDGRGLHDILAKTKVITCDKNKNEAL